MALRYLTARLAQQIDEELMGPAGAFTLEQLMELAGLACAQALAVTYSKDKYPRVLVCCGPGNQGGDGLVAARHLGMFGYKPTIYMPKPGSKDHYKRLLTQCTNMSLPVLPPSLPSSPSPSPPSPSPTPASPTPTPLESALSKSDIILDAIFGFSFQGPLRPPFDTALPLLARSGLPIVSVDIPSGWDVERGNVGINVGKGKGEWEGLNPDVLVSLTAPKMGVRMFGGRHFLGGRFVTKAMEEKYELNLPEYPGCEQIVELPRVEESSGQKL
ncbi:NAD(P)H-hydrate epimerase [Hypsizygus marmoreus]|uniref:NAD(P)H-hydrate epimerase n=1 Tax=Hypsizygus marmoreus TaxID=39966 RepID=A0A369J0B7_HYPMA|nr:NAD(P)H-hydrate epimerase [Hypsizygus marmoreus]